MTNVASAPTGMRLKTIATLFAVSAVILTGSPAFATQISRHDAHCSSGACSQHYNAAQHANGGNTVPDHWPNNMILG